MNINELLEIALNLLGWTLLALSPHLTCPYSSTSPLATCIIARWGHFCPFHGSVRRWRDHHTVTGSDRRHEPTTTGITAAAIGVLLLPESTPRRRTAHRAGRCVPGRRLTKRERNNKNSSNNSKITKQKNPPSRVLSRALVSKGVHSF